MNALQDNLDQLQAYLLAQLQSRDPQLSDQLQASVARGGKRLRPAFAFLTARLCDPSLAQEQLLPLEAAIEMVHSASLIHDDIIDEAPLRRGRPSLHLEAGAKAAIRQGDYLLAKALLLLSPYNDPRLYALLAASARAMCQGELQQISGRFSLERQNLPDYFLRIRRKTASLFAACCEMGALLGGATAQQQAQLARFGLELGLAFQIEDDLLDYQGPPGKPRGQDLRQGIFTLPLLYTLQVHPQAADLARLAVQPQKSPVELEQLLTAVLASPGFTRAQAVAAAFRARAGRILLSFPDNPARQQLQQLLRT